MAEGDEPGGSIFRLSAAIRRGLWPNLPDGSFTKTSEPNKYYNCVAFALGDFENWHDSTRFGKWDDRAPRDGSVKSYIKYFELNGFVLCEASEPEDGFEKVAIFEDAEGNFAHVALQLPDGRWKSKLGQLEDILHVDLQSISDGDYGTARYFMKRDRTL